MMNFTKVNTYKESRYLLCLVQVGLFNAAFLVLGLITKFFINPISGYSINLKVVWYVMVLLLPNVSLSTKVVFATLSPIVALVFGFTGINFFQVVIEYIFAYWILLILLLFPGRSQWFHQRCFLRNLLFFLLVSLAFTCNFLLHFLAGIIWWAPGNYLNAAILNFNYVIISYIISVPIALYFFIFFRFKNKCLNYETDFKKKSSKITKDLH